MQGHCAIGVKLPRKSEKISVTMQLSSVYHFHLYTTAVVLYRHVLVYSRWVEWKTFWYDILLSQYVI